MGSASLGAVILQVTSGSDAGRKIEIGEGQRLQIGRGANADVAISDDPSLSRLHFTLQHAGAAVVLRDLGSSNGTLVNGARVSSRQLADGDTIVAGETSFGVRLVRAMAPAARPTPVRQQPVALPAEPVEPRAATPGADARNYESALADDDATARQEVLLAAAWTRQPWLLDHCRRRATTPSPELWPELWMLAVLGGPEDLPLIQKAAEESSLGPRRLALAASYGHPQLVVLLLREMDSTDPMTAQAAGRAFARVTGCEVWSDRKVAAAPTNGAEPDAFEREFADDVTLPSRERAEDHWRNVQREYTASTRWCRGMSLNAMTTDAALEDFDLEARHEVGIWRRYNAKKAS